MEKKNLVAGIAFLFGTVVCVYSLITREFQTLYVTGAVVFTIVGVAFLKRANTR